MVFSDSWLLIFSIYCYLVIWIHFVMLTYVVYKFCLVLWLLSVAGCWVRISTSPDHLVTATSGKAVPRALPQVKEYAHKDAQIDLADEPPVLSHPLFLQRVLPVAKMVFQDWRLPSVVVTGKRRGWVKPVAELLPPTFSSRGTRRRESLSL